MASGEHMEFDGDRNGQAPAESLGLFAARRKFITGSVGLTAFAATLSSRRAFAGGSQNQCGPISLLCSPTHSGSQTAQSCTGYHCDQFCQNAQTSNWGGWTCNNQTFGSCGWTSSPSGCTINPNTRLCDALNSCYSQQQQQNYFGYYGYQNTNNCQNSQWNSWYGGGNNNPCGLFTYNTNCDASSQGIQGWIACGLLNCQNRSAGWVYTCPEFVQACQSVYQSRCVSNCDEVLCGLISSLCQSGRRSQGCGGQTCLWNNWG